MPSPTLESGRDHTAGREADDPGDPWEVVSTVGLPQGLELRVLRRIDPERGPLVALVRAPSQGPQLEGIELPREVIPEVIRGLAYALDTGSEDRSAPGERDRPEKKPDPSWKFRATYPVPSEGVLEGDWITLDDGGMLVGRRRPEPGSLLRHLLLFRRVEGPPLQAFLERYGRDPQSDPPARGDLHVCEDR